MSGRRAMQSSNVPCWPGTVPWLRGTISYQAPARARGRSTMTGMAMLRVRSPRGSLAATASASSSASRISTSGTRSNCRRARSMIRLMFASRTFSSPRSSRPSWASRVRTWPASRLSSSSFAPCRELVGPGFDRKQVAARLGRGELAMPAVVSGQEHRLAPPVGLGFLPPQQFGRQLIVPFAEQIGPYFNGFAGNALDRIAAAVDAGIDVLDQEPRARSDRSAPSPEVPKVATLR